MGRISIESAKAVLEMADIAFKAVEFSHHHHLPHMNGHQQLSGDNNENQKPLEVNEIELENLRLENGRLRDLLQQNLKLLQNISKSPCLFEHFPPDVKADVTEGGQVMRQRDEDLAKEVEFLKQKIQELEQLAKGKGLAGEVRARFVRDNENKLMRSSSYQNISSSVRGKVKPEDVIGATTLAANGQPFEVAYYPRASTPEFCVKASSLTASLNSQWCAGMRFKIPFETEDSSRISWFMGTVSSVEVADPFHWPNSPWRLLQALSLHTMIMSLMNI